MMSYAIISKKTSCEFPSENIKFKEKQIKKEQLAWHDWEKTQSTNWLKSMYYNTFCLN